MSRTVDLLHLAHAQSGRLYIACEDWNFAWTPQELETVRLLRAEERRSGPWRRRWGGRIMRWRR